MVFFFVTNQHILLFKRSILTADRKTRSNRENKIFR